MRPSTVALVLALLATLAAAQNGTAPSNSTTTCKLDALDMHNWLRAIHQAPNLTWSDRLASDAQAWANHLAQSGCSQEYASTPDGENVASLDPDPGADHACYVATAKWYMNGVHWNYSNTPSIDNKATLVYTAPEDTWTAPFTQVVWAGSRQIGCAAVEGATGCWSVVCRYSPGGISAGASSVPSTGLPLAATDAAFVANVKPPIVPANITAADSCNSDHLAGYNKHRAAHLSPAMSWDAAMAIASQAWANVLARRDCKALKSNWPGGEGITTGTTGYRRCSSVAELRYTAVVAYNFTDTPWTDNKDQISEVRPFVTMVFAGSTKLGCGRATGETATCWVWHCMYGDYTGEWNDTSLLANVKPMQPLVISSTQQTRQEAALALNNQYRAAHGAPPLTWSDQYAAGTQGFLVEPSEDWTGLLLLNSTLNVTSTFDGGVLLFWTNSSSANNDTILNMAVEAWYTSGSARYNFTTTPYTDNKDQLENGDGGVYTFSQVVWASTKQIGCTSAFDIVWWAVCKYGPTGNTPLDVDYLQNVLPPGGIQVSPQSSPAPGSSAPPGSSSTPQSSAPPQSSPPPESSSSTPVGLIVGVCVGVGVALLAAVVGVAWWYRRRRQQPQQATDNVWAGVEAPKAKALSVALPDTTMSGFTGYPGAPGPNSATTVVMSPGIQHSSQTLATSMPIPGLMTGEPFTRGTAFAYSWNEAYTPAPGVTQAVENGVNDVQLDSMVQSSGGTVQDCPVLSLSKEDVQQQLQLLTGGLLGRGGAALVFKALWPSRFGPDALLAVKVLKDGYDSNPYILQSFAHEASVLASVRHPNVVRLYGYCLEPPNVCLVMELLPGSLKQVLYGMKGVASTTAGPAMTATSLRTSSHGNTNTDVGPPSSLSPPASSLQPAEASTNTAAPLTMAQVLKYSTDIAAGLAYLHEQPEQPITLADGQAVAPLETLAEADSGLITGSEHPTSGVNSKIVHRDLKPANILINSRDVAKITDFGLARRHDNTTIETRHVGAGTVPYQAPEVLSGAHAGAYGLKATNRCDIYSMAMIMWELLAKQPPWHGMNEMAILGAVVHGRRPELPPPQQAGPDNDALMDLSQLPASLTALPAFNDIIRQCWAQRDLRRPTAGELHSMLAALQQQRQAGTPEARVQITLLDGAPK